MSIDQYFAQRDLERRAAFGDTILPEYRVPRTVALVPAMLCEDCEFIGEQDEFLPRAGTATVPNPPICPRCRSTNLSQGETEKEVLSV